MEDILKKPLITEKVTDLNEEGIYGFIVDKKANKIQIKKAVEETYNVNVKKVNTMNYGGKKKIRYTKSQIINGKTNTIKKALVYLEKDEIIDFYSGI